MFSKFIKTTPTGTSALMTESAWGQARKELNPEQLKRLEQGERVVTETATIAKMKGNSKSPR